MLPDANDAPPAPPKRTGGLPVSLAVAREFRQPVGGIAAGLPAVQWAAMPKAPVNEYRDTSFLKHEIGAARQCEMPPPAGDAMGTKDRREL
jgi:hypothetical protein